MKKRKVAVVIGTRPEAIKMVPVVMALKSSEHFECEVCVTGQHKEMLDQVMTLFDLVPDRDLALMRPNQTLGGLTARAIKHLDAYFAESQPDLVLVQGDTTTVFCAALAAFYHQIPVGHVEAGLRTGNIMSPWPEEANRKLASVVTAFHFAPTEVSRRNLLDEGVPSERIWVTGNTVIDTLQLMVQRVRENPPVINGLPAGLQPSANEKQRRMVLITGHRRENFGGGFERICAAIGELGRSHPDVDFIYPVHLNPNVRSVVEEMLGSGRDSADVCPNTHLIEPLEYIDFVAMMDSADIILTDSGGVQEEAPSLGKPVLVMRENTERPEALDAGTVKLVGTDTDAIVSNVTRLLDDAMAYAEMAQAVNPYGDGKASGRIVQALAVNLHHIE